MPDHADRHALADRNFLLQQGLVPPDGGASCNRLSSALRFQGRVVGVALLAAIRSRSPLVFLALAASLAWGGAFPRSNPYDALYRRTLGRRPGAPPLPLAPPPRRFAQGMAATFATACAALLAAERRRAAAVTEAVFLLAVGALALGRFCLGSFTYHLLRGRLTFVRRTVPWGPGA